MYTEALEKTSNLAHHSFPESVAADIRDIEGSTNHKDLANISNTITQTESKEIVR